MRPTVGRRPRACSARKAWGCLGALSLALGLILGAKPARAGSQALLVWIGDYGSQSFNLPGAPHDAERARDIARMLGVPDAQRQELKQGEVTLDNFRRALDAMLRRVGPGDRVFIYFSGHGRQVDGAAYGHSRCNEGLVMRDGSLFLDIAVEEKLRQLAVQAAQVVMMNDSCHSGGAATKQFSLDDDGAMPKAYPGAVRLPAGAAGRACGEAVNGDGGVAKLLSRSLQATERWVYLAASADNEVAWATPNGSLATRAWHACLRAAVEPQRGGAHDTNRDGRLDAAELTRCAQARIDGEPRRRQRLETRGEASLPLLSGLR